MPDAIPDDPAANPCTSENGLAADPSWFSNEASNYNRRMAAGKSLETELRQVIDAIPVLVWCNYADGPNEFLNKKWHDYTGLSHEESHGWGWQVAFHPEDLPPLMEKWRALLA